jgi:hypothetical protein
MGRPAFALVALGGVPLLDAAGADAAGVEGVPFVAAEAAPQLVARGLPIAKGAADAWAGEAGPGACLFVRDNLAHGDLDTEYGRNVSGIVQACRAK